jgi:hypothetical protein
MSRNGRVLLILVCIVGLVLLGVIARTISRYFSTDFGLTYLACLLMAYAAVSALAALQRHRLVRRLRDLPAAERAKLAETSPELRHAAAETQGGLSARAATWIGVLLINGPLIPIMVGPLFVAQHVRGSNPSAAFVGGLLLLGFVLVWSWWSVGVTLWRRWAARRGIDPDELQWRGENATLLWPRGHRFEQTELGQLLKRVARRRPS